MVSATQQMPSRDMDLTKMAIVMGVLTITLTIGGKMKLKLNIAILMHMSFLPIKCSHILLPYFNRIRDHWHRQYNGRKTVFCCT